MKLSNETPADKMINTAVVWAAVLITAPLVSTGVCILSGLAASWASYKIWSN